MVMRLPYLAIIIGGALGVAAENCQLVNLFPQQQPTVALNATEMLAFTGASFSMTIKDAAGQPFENFKVIKTTGDLKIQNEWVVISGNNGGQIVTKNQSKECVIKFPKIPANRYFWVHDSEVTYDEAAMLAGGSERVGEFYLDASKEPIHLRLDANNTRKHRDNWFIVSTGAPANLTTEPTITMRNREFVPTKVGNMITLIQMQVLQREWGYNLYNYLLSPSRPTRYWISASVPLVAVPKPFFDATGVYTHGVAPMVDVSQNFRAKTVSAVSGNVGLMVSKEPIRSSSGSIVAMAGGLSVLLFSVLI